MRHRGVANLLKKYCPPSAKILDVGGEVSYSSNHIGRFVNGHTITTANVRPESDVKFTGKVLPFEDDSFDAVISIDTVEHVPPEQRHSWLRELTRVSRKLVVLAGPVASDFNCEADKYLSDLYEQLHGKPHQLAEHVIYGRPTVDEIAEWDEIIRPFTRTAEGIRFEGDSRIWKRHYGTIFRIDTKRGLLRIMLKLPYLLWTMTELRPLRLTETLEAYTQRFYLAYTI
jgi:hypothetical protein